MLPTLETSIVDAKRPIAAFVRTDRHWRFDWHHHAQVEIVQIRAGTGTRLVGDDTGTFAPGQTVILGQWLPHAWASPAGESAEREAIVVQLTHDAIDQLSQLAGGGLDGLVKSARRGVLFERTSAVIDAALDEIVAAETTLTRLAPMARLLATLQERLASGTPRASDRFATSARPPSPDPRIRRIVARLEAAGPDAFDGQSAAATCGLSHEAFCRAFKRATGTTFVAWQQQMRVRSAMRLLRETDKAVTAVASASGFDNLSHFNRLFKRYTGRTPRQYRGEPSSA
ncbi:MAG: AraC family transcriptional regulator [Planctomycetota bacterium]